MYELACLVLLATKFMIRFQFVAAKRTDGQQGAKAQRSLDCGLLSKLIAAIALMTKRLAPCSLSKVLRVNVITRVAPRVVVIHGLFD